MHRSIRRLALPLTLALATPLAAQPVPLGPVIPVYASAAEASHYAPAVAVGADGGLLVAWEEADVGHLLARGFSATGEPRSASARQIGVNNYISFQDPHLAALPAGGYVAVSRTDFRRSGPAGAPTDQLGKVSVRHLDATGQPVGDEIWLNPGIGPGAWETAVAVAPSGHHLVAWVYENGQVKARLFSPAGALLGQEVTVTAVGSAPSVAALPDGGFVVAWGRPGDVMLRFFAADGTPSSSEFWIDGPLTAPVRSVQVGTDAAGRLVVAWLEGPPVTQFPNDPSGSTIRVRRLDSSLQPLGPAITVHTETGIVLEDLAVRPDGSFLVLWADADWDLLARSYGADGTPAGDAVTVRASSNTFGALGPTAGDAAPSGTGWAVAWVAPHDLPTEPDGPFLQSFAAGTACSGLCLQDGRFAVEVTWRVSSTGAEGTGTPIPLTGDTGAFWFFAPSNYELVVKVLDGRGTNGHFWVFYGSLTDVEFDLTITDVLTGQQRTYHNPAGTMASHSDTQAF